jgi:hypothetical protein
MKNRPQCKDIPDEVILAACDRFRESLDRRGWRNSLAECPTPEVALAHLWPAKLILAKMQSMVRRGLLEYGVSLRTAWRKVR